MAITAAVKTKDRIMPRASGRNSGAGAPQLKARTKPNPTRKTTTVGTNFRLRSTSAEFRPECAAMDMTIAHAIQLFSSHETCDSGAFSLLESRKGVKHRPPLSRLDDHPPWCWARVRHRPIDPLGNPHSPSQGRRARAGSDPVPRLDEPEPAGPRHFSPRPPRAVPDPDRPPIRGRGRGRDDRCGPGGAGDRERDRPHRPGFAGRPAEGLAGHVPPRAGPSLGLHGRRSLHPQGEGRGRTATILSK